MRRARPHALGRLPTLLTPDILAALFSHPTLLLVSLFLLGMGMIYGADAYIYRASGCASRAV